MQRNDGSVSPNISLPLNAFPFKDNCKSRSWAGAIAWLLLPGFSLAFCSFLLTQKDLFGFALVIIAVLIILLIPDYAFSVVILGSFADYLPFLWGSVFRFLLAFSLIIIFTRSFTSKSKPLFNQDFLLAASLSLVIFFMPILFSEFPLESVKGSWYMISGVLTGFSGFWFVSKYGLPRSKQWVFILLNILVFFLIASIKGQTAIAYSERMTISESVNPNTFGISLAYALCLVLGCIAIPGKKAMKGFLFLVFLVGLSGLILTGSRTSFIAVVVVFIIASGMFLVQKRSFSIARTLIVVCVFFLTTYYVSFVVSRNTLFLQRFSLASIIESHGTKRFDTWIYYIQLIANQPKVLFLGLGAAPVAAFAALAKEGVPTIFKILPHNMYIRLIISWGLPGAVFVLFLLSRGVFAGIKLTKKDKNIIPFLLILMSLFIIGLGETGLGTKPIWLSLGAIFAQYSKTKNGI